MTDSGFTARAIAYGTVVAAGISASIAAGEWWALSLPFAGVAFIETVLSASRWFSLLRGKAEDRIVERAALRALALFEQRKRDEDMMRTLASLDDELPSEVVDAAKSGRLEIRVRDDE